MCTRGWGWGLLCLHGRSTNKLHTFQEVADINIHPEKLVVVPTGNPSWRTTEQVPVISCEGISDWIVVICSGRLGPMNVIR